MKVRHGLLKQSILVLSYMEMLRCAYLCSARFLLFQFCQYLQHGMYGLFKCRDFPVTQLLQHLFV